MGQLVEARPPDHARGPDRLRYRSSLLGLFCALCARSQGTRSARGSRRCDPRSQSRREHASGLRYESDPLAFEVPISLGRTSLPEGRQWLWLGIASWGWCQPASPPCQSDFLGTSCVSEGDVTVMGT